MPRFSIKNYLLPLLAIFLIFTAVPVHAAYSPEFCRKVDMLKVAESMVDKAKGGTYSSSETAMLAVGEMYETAWPVSCFVGYGLHNFEEAVNFLSKDENLNLIIDKKTGADTMSGAQMENIVLTSSKDLVDSIKNNGLLQGTVYNRAQFAGFVMLIVFFIASLTYYVVQIFLGTDEANSLDVMFLFIRFVTLAIILAFLRPMLFLGLEASTLLRGSLVTTPVTVVAGLGQTASNMYWPQGEEVDNPWLGKKALVTGGFGLMDTVTNANGTQRSRSSAHKGVDFRAAKGTPIYAPVSGMMTCHITPNKDTGIYVEIAEVDPPQFRHRALHLSEVNCSFDGATRLVTKGEEIGKTGNTGQYEGKDGKSYGYVPHLHIDLKRGNEFIHPAVGYVDEARKAYLDQTLRVNAPQTSNININYGLTTQTAGAGTQRTGTDTMTLDMLYGQMMDIKLKAAYAGQLDVEKSSNDRDSLWGKLTGAAKTGAQIVTGNWKELGTGLVVRVYPRFCVTVLKPQN